MPLAEVRPGMQGVWETVVSGSALSRFELKVLGIVPNFAGPGKSVILCEALGDDQVLSGPVAGMSGSPVYFDGKLAGAYAYGFTWPKQQTLIGVTPIEDMLPLVRDYHDPDWSQRYRKAFNNGRVGLALARQTETHSAGLRSTDLHSGSEMSAPPFTIHVSGIRPEVLGAFETQARELGVVWSETGFAAASGESAAAGPASMDQLEAGMPVAGVLMGGDFSFTGVGTVTWKEGDRILAFGHPFFAAGEVSIPMAGAEIITVVRSLEKSFKLSVVGPVVGSIIQDRASGIAGKIGLNAPTTAVEYEIEGKSGAKTTYRAQLFEHPRLAPLLAAMAFLQSTQSHLEAEENQTLFLEVSMEIDGHEPLRFSNVAVGESGAMSLAFQLYQVMGAITDNPFEFPRIHSLRCKVRMDAPTRYSFFDEVRVTSDVPAPGEELAVSVRVRRNLGDPVRHDLRIPVPIGTKGQTLTLQIADATQLETPVPSLLRADMDSLEDVIREANQQRSQQQIYVRLLRNAPGLRLQGDTLYDLPPSVTALYQTPKNAQYSSQTEEIAVWEQALPTDGLFVGAYRLNVEIK
jgi:hypothetical protein